MRLLPFIRFVPHKKMMDWMVSFLWISLLLFIVVWSAWIVLNEKNNLQALKAVKDATEFTVESFTVKQFGNDDKAKKGLAGAQLHFEPSTQTFSVEKPAADAVFFSKAKQDWSQVYMTGSHAVAIKTSSSPNVAVLAPRLIQQFPGETVRLSADQGVYQDHFLIATGNVFFDDSTKNLRAGQLKYDISQGGFEILGRASTGQISKEASGRVHLEFELP